MRALLILLVAGPLLHGVPAVQATVPAQPTGPAAAAVPEEEEPYGAASSWLLGHRLLLEGDAKGALPYLHFSYRAQPDVPAIALDFQDALVAEGYFRDALEILDQLVAAHPDSADFRLRRSAVHLHLGAPESALADLQAVREAGSGSVQSLSGEARVLSGMGRFGHALKLLRQGLETYPEEGPGLYLGMAEVLERQGESAKIPDLMAEAMTRYPAAPALPLLRLRVLASLGRHDEALAVARDAERHLAPSAPSAVAEAPTGDAPEPGRPESFLLELADFYAQRGELSRAVRILEPLAAADELGLGPSLWLGRLLLGTGRNEEAGAQIAHILERWPAVGRGWFLQGKLVEGQGDWPGSLPHYRKAVELAPFDPELRLGLVRAMLVAWEGDLVAADPDSQQVSRREAVRTQALAALTQVPDADTQGNLVLGYAFRTLDDLERACSRFELAAAAPDLRLAALTQLSLCQDELGQTTQARDTLEQLRHDYPDNPEVANSLGYFLAEKGLSLPEAEALVQEALAVQPDNGAFLDSMGWVFYRAGRLEDALDYLIRAVNVLPEDPVILEHLGMALKDMGQRAEALDILRRALARGGDAERIGQVIRELEGAPAAGSRP